MIFLVIFEVTGGNELQFEKLKLGGKYSKEAMFKFLSKLDNI